MATYPIDSRVYDTIVIEKFPKLYDMMNFGTVQYTRNLRKLARHVMYERSEAVDLTREELLMYLLDNPEVYAYLQL